MPTNTYTYNDGDNNISFDAGNNDHSIVHALGGDDRISIAFGTAEIYCGEGNDNASFASNNTGVVAIIYGEGGDDSLYTQSSGPGEWQLYGGDGNDALRSLGAKGSFYGGAGRDVFNARSGTNEHLDGGSDFDYLTISDQNGLSGDTVISIEGQMGSRENDLLTSWGTDVTFGWTNILQGHFGSDILEGSGGSDLLVGGSLWRFFETLRNYDTVSFLGDDDDNVADTLNGGGGADTLIGSGGADALNGGDGLDTASYVDSASAVSANLATGINSHGDVYDSIESLIGTNANDGDVLIGNGVANVLDGLAYDDALDGAGGDDTLYGRHGNDTLIDHAGVNRLYGGENDDRYVVTVSSGIVENAGEGIDTLAIHGSSTGRLVSNVENLELIGRNSAALDGTGNELDNLITGHGGANRLDGRGGRDTLEGGAGADTLTDNVGGDVLRGGAGSDTYVILATATPATVEEAGGAGSGADTVQANGSYALTSNVENLTLTGAQNWSGTGNELANTLTGNVGRNALSGLDGADRLLGGVGNDTLDGGTGIDRLDGGAGNDSLGGGADGDLFLFAGAWGGDTIGDWQDTAGVESGQDRLDRIDLSGLTGANDVDALDDLLIRQVGTSVTITLDLDHDRIADARDLDGNGTADAVRITVLNATAANFGLADFVL